MTELQLQQIKEATELTKEMPNRRLSFTIQPTGSIEFVFIHFLKPDNSMDMLFFDNLDNLINHFKK